MGRTKVTYYCKKCKVPYDDEITLVPPEGEGIGNVAMCATVKTGNIVCRKCGNVITCAKEYI